MHTACRNKTKQTNQNSKTNNQPLSQPKPYPSGGYNHSHLTLH
jgi:hypothetical protein